MDHYQYEFEHVMGKDNIADAASRIGGKREDQLFDNGEELHEICAVIADTKEINSQLLALTNVQVREEFTKSNELQEVAQWLNELKRWPSSTKLFGKICTCKMDYL
ncbi:AAEL015094-PA [Aedes aegypti]|uniref:AAEL015094-PA n=1 Tax=Aedes aegypti TaxID=7159 RepID=Q16EM5_AEDAE|nr:AAEL015094-PA [Aedes aegypti]